MTGPVYPACIHHMYAANLRGELLREPCWVPGCPGARPITHQDPS